MHPNAIPFATASVLAIADRVLVIVADAQGRLWYRDEPNRTCADALVRSLNASGFMLPVAFTAMPGGR